MASQQLEDPFGLTGTLLEGQYRIDAVVGEGGFGVVYRGWHLALEQPIAVKVLKGLDGGDPTVNQLVLEKFRNEARLLYTLSNSSLHIVRALDFGATTTPSGAWAPFMVLEWLSGRALESDLQERRRRGLRGRSVQEAFALLRPAAEGLAVAHQHHVVHRDIKPANVFLLDAEPRVKVLDFGIAKIMKEGEAAGTKGTFASFTWLYAAPEQLDPRRGATSLATDVYGFALLLTELLTDRPPVDERDVVSIMRVATDPNRRPSPRALGANVPDAIEAVCLRALAVDPKARQASISELWGALEAAHGSRPSATAMQPAGIGPTSTTAFQAVPPATPRSIPAATSSRNIALRTPAPTPTPFMAPQGPPRGTHPPGFGPPMQGYPPPPPPVMWRPWGPRRVPFVRPDGSNLLVALTIIGFIFAALFAGTCALAHAAC
jgi:serine/threonine-protein kinase